VKKQQRRSLENKKTTKSTTVCLPQRKLTLKKSTAQVQPRVKGMKVLFLSPLGYYFFSWLAEPMPFACRNTLYDEHWSSKQERGVYFISAFDFIYIYIYIYIYVLFQLLRDGSTMCWHLRITSATLYQAVVEQASTVPYSKQKLLVNSKLNCN